MNTAFEIYKKAFELHGLQGDYIVQVYTALQITEATNEEELKTKFTPEVRSQMNIDDVLWNSICNSAFQVGKVSTDSGKIYSAQVSPPIQTGASPKAQKESKPKTPSAPREVQPDVALPLSLSPTTQTKITPQEFISKCQELQANGKEVNYQTLEENFQWKKGVVDSTVSKMSGITFPKFVKNRIWLEGNFTWS